MKIKFVLVFVMLMFGPSTGCTLSNYVNMKVMERLVQTDVVVFGRTMGHTANKVLLNGTMQYVIDAQFDVHCVMQHAEMKVSESITIKQVSPRDDCTGTLVTKRMKVGDYAILGLKKISGDDYELQELLPKTEAAIQPFKPYFFSLASLCTMQRWRQPVGATSDRCPICGIADFPSEIMGLYDPSNTVKVCPKTGSTLAIDMDACDLWMDETIDSANAQSCVPADYTSSCVSLLFRQPPADASCDCSRVGEIAMKTKTGGAAVINVSVNILIAAFCTYLLLL